MSDGDILVLRSTIHVPHMHTQPPVRTYTYGEDRRIDIVQDNDV